MPFNFCPIEPPRMDPSGAETYARRRHQFQPTNESSAKGKKSIFSRKSTSAPLTPREAPFIGVDLRLPEPAIITCNAEIPMRVVLSSLNEHRDGLSLQSLQVDLVHYTHIRAHEVVRTEAMGTTITSRSNLGITINFPEGSDNAVLDPRLWRGFTVPNNLAPSFETCNISRSYELVTRIGLKHELQNSQVRCLYAHQDAVSESNQGTVSTHAWAATTLHDRAPATSPSLLGHRSTSRAFASNDEPTSSVKKTIQVLNGTWRDTGGHEAGVSTYRECPQWSARVQRCPT